MTHPAPTFAMLSRGDLRLVLSASGGGPEAGGRQILVEPTRAEARLAPPPDPQPHRRS